MIREKTAIAAGEQRGLTRIQPPFARQQHKCVSAEFGVCSLFSLLLLSTTLTTSVFNRAVALPRSNRFLTVAALSLSVFAQQPALTQAWQLIHSNHQTEAIHLLTTYTQTNPNNSEAQLLLGTLLSDSKQYPSAIDHLNQAVHLTPNNPEAQAALGEAYLNFGDLQAARQPLEQSVTLNPNAPTPQLELGRVLLEQRDFPASAQHLDKAISLLGSDPDAATAHYLRAKIDTEQASPTEAARHLEQSLSIRPNFPEAWSDLGEARKLLGNHTAAITAFQKAVRLAPTDSVAQYRLGEEYLTQHQPHLAVEPLRHAHHLNPQDHSILNAYQKALRQDGKDKQADEIKQQLAALLKQDELDSEIDMKAVKLNNEGAKLQSAGDLRGALDKYAAAAALSPKNVPIHVNYAVAMLRLGQWTSGLNELHQSLLMNPSNTKIRAALRDALAQAPAGTAPPWESEFK